MKWYRNIPSSRKEAFLWSLALALMIGGVVFWPWGTFPNALLPNNAFRSRSLEADVLPKTAHPYRLYLSADGLDERPWRPFASDVPGIETRLREVLGKMHESLTPCIRYRERLMTEPLLLDVTLLTYAIRLLVESSQINIPQGAAAEIDCLKKHIESFESLDLASLSGEIKSKYSFRIVVVPVAPGVSHESYP